MKNIGFLNLLFVGIFIFSVSENSLHGQCPIGNLTITTQAEIDDFPNNYPGCTQINGSLTIGPSSDIENLDGLSELVEIGGYLVVIQNPLLNNISGFAGLTHVEYGITFRNNPQLQEIDLSGLTNNYLSKLEIQENENLKTLNCSLNLTNIGSDLFITNNPLLKNLTGLESLISIGRNFNIGQILEDDLPDFSNLEFVGGRIGFNNNLNIKAIYLPNVAGNLGSRFEVTHNPSLITLEAPTNLISISTDLAIRENPSLQNFTGFENLESIGNRLTINNILADDLPDFTKLQSVGGHIKIYSNSNIKEIHLKNVSGILGGDFSITNNPQLNTLEAPLHLTSISTDLLIKNNPNLLHFTGFENLEFIGRRFDITEVLEDDFPDFSNLNSVHTRIAISHNPNVKVINIPNVTGYLTSSFYVNNNSALTTLNGPTNLDSIGFDLFITGNPNLIQLSGFENLKSIGHRLDITDVIDNDFPDFSNLNYVRTRIVIGNNPNIQTIKIPNVTGYLTSVFSISSNNSLVNLIAPDNLDSIGFDLFVIGNPNLEFITGFSKLQHVNRMNLSNIPAEFFPDFQNLSSIGSSLTISQNNGITNLNWIANLISIGGILNITNNQSLSDCAIFAVCDFIDGPGNSNIAGNTGCCENKAILTNACTNPGSGGIEICDGLDNNCDGQIDEGFDLDGDGFTTCQGDCDDSDPDIHPVASEICDGLDNNCDGQIDEGFDLDGDGFTTCQGDCDDNNPTIYPGATEICDGIDNNCDGIIDEGFDLDNDGITDCFDNCPATANPDQADEDCDGLGDVCDQWPGCDDSLDDDMDGIPNCVDLDEVANWSCGNGNKVYVCHIPPGNPSNKQSICISANAVNSHLGNHGDYIGTCDQIRCIGNLRIGEFSTSQSKTIKIYPNPTTSILTLELSDYLNQNVEIFIHNSIGHLEKAYPLQNVEQAQLQLNIGEILRHAGYYVLTISVNGVETKHPFVFQKN